MRFPACLGLVLVWAAACGGDPQCRDQDVDGFGPHCAAGPDCDDTNPLRTQNCDVVDPPDCDANPFLTGCACLPGSTTSCYSGAEGTEDVGRCKGGVAVCIHGYWGLCNREVVPSRELCEGVTDEDCDGQVDEGVVSPCGGCDSKCQGDVWGEAPSPFKASQGENLVVNGAKEFTLEKDASPVPTAVWATNTLEGTVSRIDPDTETEVARYAAGAPAPSRVAVDYLGDAWVANRADGVQATVIKVAGDGSRCVDVDMVDGVETSTGPGDVRPFGEDECVVRSTPVGTASGAMARALAVDGDFGPDEVPGGGNVWVGLYGDESVVKLDGATGAVLTTVPLPGFHPFAGAFDPWGVLWLVDRDGYLARINRRADPPEVTIVEVPFACYLLSDIGVDDLGRLYLSGDACNTALRYEPRDGSWARLTVPESPRGVLVDGETVWMSHTAGYLTAIRTADFTVVDTFDLSVDDVVPFETSGVGRDGSGALWTVSGGGGGDDGLGMVTKFVPETTTDGLEGMATAMVPIGQGPETLGGITGSVLPGGFMDAGHAAHVFGQCEAGKTQWKRLHVEADAGVAGAVFVEARHATSKAKLADAEYVSLGTLPTDSSPFALDFPDDGFVEVRISLTTGARDGAPRVRRVGLEWVCSGGPG